MSRINSCPTPAAKIRNMRLNAATVARFFQEEKRWAEELFGAVDKGFTTCMIPASTDLRIDTLREQLCLAATDYLREYLGELAFERLCGSDFPEGPWVLYKVVLCIRKKYYRIAVGERSIGGQVEKSVQGMVLRSNSANSKELEILREEFAIMQDEFARMKDTLSGRGTDLEEAKASLESLSRKVSQLENSQEAITTEIKENIEPKLAEIQETLAQQVKLMGNEINALRGENAEIKGSLGSIGRQLSNLPTQSDMIAFVGTVAERVLAGAYPPSTGGLEKSRRSTLGNPGNASITDEPGESGEKLLVRFHLRVRNGEAGGTFWTKDNQGHLKLVIYDQESRGHVNVHHPPLSSVWSKGSMMDDISGGLFNTEKYAMYIISGYSGSGKTFMMSSPSRRSPSLLRKYLKLRLEKGERVLVTATEILGKTIRDLVDGGPGKEAGRREHGAELSKSKHIKDGESIDNFLNKLIAYRKTADNGANEFSSRRHLVVDIYKDAQKAEKRVATFIDLCGDESSETRSQNHEGGSVIAGDLLSLRLLVDYFRFGGTGVTNARNTRLNMEVGKRVSENKVQIHPINLVLVVDGSLPKETARFLGGWVGNIPCNF